MKRTAAFALMLILATASCASKPGKDTPGMSAYRTSDRTDKAVAAGATRERMDASRKIAEQDCSKPVALDQGNLKCR